MYINIMLVSQILRVYESTDSSSLQKTVNWVVSFSISPDLNRKEYGNSE